MTLRNLSYKEIKTINGGSSGGADLAFTFPILRFFGYGILDTLYNLKGINKNIYNGAVGLLEW